MHLGHLGSSSDSITYMRHLGHPTSTIDVASGLLEYFPSSSDDTHELGGDVGDTVAERLGVATCGLRLGDRLSFKSSFGPFLLLIFLFSSSSSSESWTFLQLSKLSPTYTWKTQITNKTKSVLLLCKLF